MFERKPRVKTLLYVYRVLLTGIHLMRSGVVEASLPVLLEEYPREGVGDLVAAKMRGAEKRSASEEDVRTHRPRYQRLLSELETARDVSHLPARSEGFEAVDDLVIRVRLARGG